MKNGKKKTLYKVFTTRPFETPEGERTMWIQIGRAFSNEVGGMTVLLDALPLDGKLVILPQDREEDESSKKANRKNRRYELDEDDDTPPFDPDEDEEDEDEIPVRKKRK